MADEGNVKTPLDALQDTHKEQKQYEKMVDEVLKRQNQFQESITPLIEAYEGEISRLKAATE